MKWEVGIRKWELGRVHLTFAKIPTARQIMALRYLLWFDRGA